MTERIPFHLYAGVWAERSCIWAAAGGGHRLPTSSNRVPATTAGLGLPGLHSGDPVVQGGLDAEIDLFVIKCLALLVYTVTHGYLLIDMRNLKLWQVISLHLEPVSLAIIQQHRESATNLYANCN